jgi:hypothetical protein
MFRTFGTSALLTIVAILLALFTMGPVAAVTTLVLIAVEVSFSFDNAIINAKVLEKLSPRWQQLFLTVGMIIAILGMRLVFPIVIVMVTAHLPWGQVIDDALHHPDVYGRHLTAAHDSIAAFGGSFLFILALYFLLDDEREVLWLHRIERPLQRIGGAIWLPPLIAAVVLFILALFTGDRMSEIVNAGLIGVASYTVLKLFIDWLGKLEPKGKKHYTGWAAFLAFMYLQVLDASFSFDGVLGAFAITDKVLLIALGLGVGALWVRSLTVFMVRRGTLSEYEFLEHGAHYAILVLAVALLSSIYYEIPDMVTGIVGLGVIGASFKASHERRLERLQAAKH